MGNRGPAPTPTALKIVKGEKPARINRTEPKPDPTEGPPEPLEWLSEGAKEVWLALSGEMHRKSVLTFWDVHGFAVFCEAVVHHREACRAVDGSALLVRGDKGRLVKNPALQIVRDEAQIIRAFGQEFGLTPSARSGIEMPEGDRFEEARKLLS